jgi:hypothetical protein
MVSTKIIEASNSGYVEGQLNKFLKEKGLQFSDGYRIHYSTSQHGTSVRFSILIEYEDS